MTKKKPVGWRREHARHVVAGKGIPTVVKPAVEARLVALKLRERVKLSKDPDFWPRQRTIDGRKFLFHDIFEDEAQAAWSTNMLRKQGGGMVVMVGPLPRAKAPYATSQPGGKWAVYYEAEN